MESKEHQSAQSLLRWIIGFLCVFQAKYHIPNSAIDLLIKFMSALFCVLSYFSPFVRILQKSFPPSLHVMRKRFVDDIVFRMFPVCPKCNTVYESYDSRVEKIGTKKSSKYCSHVEFSDHPYKSKRTECKSLLLRSVQFTSGQKILYPFKIIIILV